MALTLIALVRVYQHTLSVVIRAVSVRCLHYPSCSEYAVLALRKYPWHKATRLSWRRYRDCQPFSGRPYIDLP
jgi:putative component of membrane protein insertase Oxa1/YidC/SpoIIIJ protein YidD